MSVLEIQARVKARIWQAVAQSGVDTSSLPQGSMDQLVNTLTEHMLLEMGTLLEETEAAAPTAPAAATPAESLAPTTDAVQEHTDAPVEPVLWEGHPFLSLGVHYQITSERVRIVEGILGKEREDIELVRIQHIDQTQTLAERMLNIGDITIRSHDPTHPTSILRDIRDVQSVHEILRRAVLDARKRNNLTYREEM
jgi:hypothetical protein